MRGAAGAGGVMRTVPRRACGALVAACLVVLIAACQRPVDATADRPPPGPTEDRLPRVTFLGDSWTVGVGATGMHGYAYLAGERLGWESVVLGVSGSGYTVAGVGTTFGERVDRVVGTDPDVVVVQGSLNERWGEGPAVLGEAALTTLSRLSRAVDRRTEILVVGASYTPGTPDETIEWINEAVGTAAESLQLTFVDPAAENWTDPADPEVWADPDHPSDAGHQKIADRLVPLLTELVED
jgi:lysophospholipase L1-like esterase